MSNAASPLPAELAPLLEAVLNVSSDLEMHQVLTRIVRSACELTGARYGALGVLDPSGRQLVEFIADGMDDEERAAIDHPPSGLGVLGLLVADPRPMRIADVSHHPAAHGFPKGHPPMSSFLGAPIRVRGEVFGNLYLTDKRDRDEFSETDESVLVTLAYATGVAIDNARRYGAADRERRWSEAVSDISQLLLGRGDDGRAIDLVAERAAAVAEAAMAVVAITDDEGELVVRAVVGPEPKKARARIGSVLAGAHWSEILQEGEPLLLISHPGEPSAEAITGRLRESIGLAVHGATAIVPMVTGPQRVGLLVLGWMAGSPSSVFDALDPLAAYAADVALTLTAARAQHDRELVALLEDRHRIARDMHDVVIQQLYATGLSLQSSAGLKDRAAVQRRVDAAVDELDLAIKEIRRTILDLNRSHVRENPVEDLRALVLTFRPVLGFAPKLKVTGDLGHLDVDMFGHLVAVVRESLSNIARHAQATKAGVQIWVSPELVRVRVSDNGVGIPTEITRRSGLRNLTERAEHSGGQLVITSVPGQGTLLEWCATP